MSNQKVSENLSHMHSGAKAAADPALPHDHGEVHELAHLRGQLSQTESFDRVTEVFRQLGDSTRIRLFWLLCHCEECVINLSAMLGMSSPALAHHLRILKSSGLIQSRRVGKEVYYKAADSQESRLLHEMIESMMEIVCPDVRLKDVEDRR